MRTRMNGARGPSPSSVGHPRLLVGVVLLGCLLALGVGLSQYIAIRSDSPTVDLVLITAWMATAVTGALWWTRGSKPVLVVGIVLVELLLGRVVTGDFFVRYVRTGYFDSTLRSSEPHRRIAAVVRMVQASDDRLVDYTGRITALLDDPEPEVARVAIRGLGYVAERMRRSVGLGGSPGWPSALLEHLRSEVLPRIEAWRVGSVEEPEVRARVYALAGFGARSVRDTQLSPTSPTWDGAGAELPWAEAIDVVRSGDRELAMAIERRLVTAANASALSVAAWIETQFLMASDAAGEPVIPVSELAAGVAQHLSEMPLAAQCITVASLATIRDPSVVEALFALVEASSASVCPSVEMAQPFGRPIVIAEGGDLNVLAILAIAGVAQGNLAIAARLQTLSERPGIGAAVAENAKRAAELARSER